MVVHRRRHAVRPTPGDGRIDRRPGDEGELLVTSETPQLQPGDEVVASTTYDQDGTDRTVTVVHRP